MEKEGNGERRQWKKRAMEKAGWAPLKNPGDRIFKANIISYFIPIMIVFYIIIYINAIYSNFFINI